MRLSSSLIVLGAFLVGAALSVLAARAAVSTLEERSVEAVRSALIDEDLSWASVQGDGLQVILEGTAPTEALLFRAISTAGTQVDAARVINNMRVAESLALAPPRFSIEILRNDAGVSLIGLIPASENRQSIVDRARSATDGADVADLLQIADYPSPPGWSRALDYGLRALSELERSKISISAETVAVTAISDSEEHKARLEAALNRRRPENIGIQIDISAPRPVISPFTVRFVMDDTGPRFDACSADGPATVERILQAARTVGWAGDDPCTLGLGMPSQTWGDAVAMSIATLSDLGGGSVTFSDADVTLVAAGGTAQALFDREIGELENALPEVFALFPILPASPDAPGAGPPEFTATLSPEGLVQLRGRVGSEVINETARNFARARFGSGEIVMGTRIAEGLPGDWAVRVLAGIEALALLSNGAVIVTPDTVSVRGNTGRRNASAELARLLSEKLGGEAQYEIDVAYVEQLDPISAQPTAEECIAQINALTARSKITFEPGSSSIEGAAEPVMDGIAEIFRRCTDMPIEIAGYTDSQGRESMNLHLSEERAQAVLDALRERRVPTRRFQAIGYGEADPIATNETEAGREANRRIEFRLIEPEPERETGLEALEEEMPEADGVDDTPAAAVDGEITDQTE